MASAEALPEYAPALADYHRAFEAELRAMISVLPVKEGDRLLEVACGEGVYAQWLAERVGESGGVVGVDISQAYLEVARRRTDARPLDQRLLFATSSVERLPFADDTFDLVWCAQSLYSLPRPLDAVRGMKRVVRPGGVVAILEDDTFHRILLPWPVEVELAIRRAELLGFIETSSLPRKFYIGRDLCGLFRAAGLSRCRVRTWASDRQAPLSHLERSFLDGYLSDLRAQVSRHLSPSILRKFTRLVDPGSDRYLLDQPDLCVTCLDRLAWGVKAEPGRSSGAVGS